ncbi:MBL fold metallo-hydrolase [Opitutales bacterium]|nr:MBL fold metallo-hydrolase [Opitutales bacterium]
MQNDEIGKIQLEDFHEDIIGKAMRGLGIGKNEMAGRLQCERSEVEAILYGRVDESLIFRMAKELNLDTEKLLRSARKEWCPASSVINGLKQFNMPFGEMLVNVFVAWDDHTKRAWVFDTGPLAEPILDFLNQESLLVDSIFLTHTHRDHIACLDELRKGARGSSVYVHEMEAMDGCTSIREGFQHRADGLSVEALHTHGHAMGGISYVIEGLDKPVSIVGDAIFAGSMGGGMISYEDALRTNREKIMTLPDDTVLCPGHGPMTTVGEEKENNPFF